MTQPTVPLWFAVIIVVMQAMVLYAMAQTDVTFIPVVKLGIGLVGVGLTTLAAALNIKKPSS